ncbi:hypothetical protein XBKB1_550007 [Xenorhabdus bovienii str. kraussei Becker Underwood]|uniref:DUF112 domain-containing protein n=1 Tax=Xenorhabdus bovienii str. kraussei Becker Underwood TaxID=1398204 RepID=A0A077PZZ6_XENBV|nr:hypothetical protein XBKB1_550007 [Xenorhabdus bovienii str. kraussei Becker Underwood]
MMDTWIYLSQGFEVALMPKNLVIALIGCFIGTVVGMLPGLGPINGVAILLPLAFALKLPAESALILLATVYIGCEYGGRISSILLNVPGDAAAIMTALDGHPMAKQCCSLYFCGQFVLWLTFSHYWNYPVRAYSGKVVFGIWASRIFCPDGFCYRLSRQHDEPESYQVFTRRLNRFELGYSRSRCQYRGLSFHL